MLATVAMSEVLGVDVSVCVFSCSGTTMSEHWLPVMVAGPADRNALAHILEAWVPAAPSAPASLTSRMHAVWLYTPIFQLHPSHIPSFHESPPPKKKKVVRKISKRSCDLVSRSDLNLQPVRFPRLFNKLDCFVYYTWIRWNICAEEWQYEFVAAGFFGRPSHSPSSAPL